MKRLFVVSDKEANPRPNATYQLDTDLLRGFNSAAGSGQTLLALRYLSHMFDVLEEKFQESQNNVEAKQEDPKPKAVKAKTAATVEEDSPEA